MHERVTRAGRSSPAVSTREQISFGTLLRGTPSEARRDSLVCQSSMTMTGALASYDIPEQPIQKSMPVWLSRCIAEAAKHLDQAPFLQLMMSLHADSSFLHHSVPSAVVQVPQLWQGIAEHLAEASPEVVVLIHPINMTSSHSNRSLQAARETAKYSSTDVLTGIAVGTEPALTWQQKHAERMESCARMMQSGLSIPALSGSIGDCCDDVAKAQVPLANNILPRSRKSDRLKAEQQGLGQGVEYWGVVIQSRWSSEADGCYVLKTIRSAVEDCTCVHYSLVNVCQGEPYSAQMAARWLTT
ncbi:hypothetical protein WJX75_002185 [Coccomyxa subellipsoidea]|uniref:Uncharacterized protein n=1 Tax=Coccomyxa subellipsoidea TaxID=248742 RepID=A0ABR2YEN6_9CHLO